ncbi:hypothetical protein Taro_025488, partial [Colocasia esculenta]|nr:hypothetical protein [Colocasia esculenta]
MATPPHPALMGLLQGLGDEIRLLPKRLQQSKLTDKAHFEALTIALTMGFNKIEKLICSTSMAQDQATFGTDAEKCFSTPPSLTPALAFGDANAFVMIVEQGFIAPDLAMSKLVKFYKEWTCKSEASESQTTLVEAFLAEERYVDHKGILFRKASRMSSRGKSTTAGKHSVEGEGQSSRAPVERRTKFRDDRLPELNVPSNIKLRKVKGVFKKIIQPWYVDFRSVEDMFPGLTKLFEEQGWLRFMMSQRSYSPSAVLEFYNNLAMTKDELYTTVQGISFKITSNLFSRALQIPNDGVDVLTLEMDLAVTYTMMTNEPFDELKRIARLNANTFPPLNRMIHHMFTTIIFPNDGSRELVRQCFRDPKRFISYACPITSVIKFVGVSLTANEVITLKSRSAYDITTATRMGYIMINGRVHMTLKGQADEEQEDEDTEEATEQDDEDVGADEAHIDIPQEVHPDIPTASQVPMSRDLKEFFAEQFNQLQSTLIEKLDQLNNRMEAIEENQGHMQRQLDTMDYGMMRLHDDYQNLRNFYNTRDPQGDNFSINVSSFGAQ